jgi:hypothetical protein
MKENVFNLNVARARLDRNAFDLTHNDVFSCAPGMLLPVSSTEVLPNEHYEINPQIFLRTMPLNSAAFVRMRQHIEFFFVPMRVLCRQFNQFVVGTKYPISAIDSLNDFDKLLPRTSLQFLKIALSPSSQSELNLDGMGSDVKVQGIRLLDMLGYGVTSANQLDSVPSSYFVSPFRLAAYQKIYSDYYRNPYYESVDVASFNLDTFFGRTISGHSSVPAERNVLRSLLRLRYRNWSKDYFTAVQPQFEGAPFVTRNVDMGSFSTLSNLPDNSSACASFVPSNDPNVSLGDDKASYSRVSSLIPKSTISDFSDLESLNLSVHNIRAAFALDKLLRLQQQAGNGSYGEQIRNRFGAAHVHDDWKAQYLGGSSAPISISEVITTANTASDVGDGLTGDIYGKASSVNDGRIVFDSSEHGIIMGIFSVSPDADYNASGVDPHNLKLSFEQFFQPEFDRLGKQPLNSFQLSVTKPVDLSSSITWSDHVIGYQNRYMEYKVGIDKVHGAFCTGGSLSAWSAPRNSGLLFDSSTISTEPVFNLYSLKVSPKILNSICSVEFSGSSLDTDPIIVDAHIGIKAIRPMSVSGEPLLS